MELLVGSTKSRKSAASIATRYTDYCLLHKRVAFPVSYKSVADYLIYYVGCNSGSTKSLGHVLAALKTSSYFCGCEWLKDSARYKLSCIIKQLEYEDKVAVKQKRPLVLASIEKMLDGLDLDKPRDLLVGMSMVLCHNSLMRSGELLSGLLVGDFEWDLKSPSVTVFLIRSKAHRKGGGEYIRLVDNSGRSAYKLLTKWFDMFHLWGRHALQVLPHTVNGGTSRECFNFSKPASSTWWRRAISKCILRIGLDPQYYSGHSFRAGGATDLFVARVPYSIIKAMGRWKSDAALKYYRDEQDVAGTVAAAFGRSLVRDNKDWC